MTDTLTTTGLEASFARDGFAVLPGALSGEETHALIAEAARICRGELGPIEGPPPGAPASA
uniref:hypothetical protein n=1 Tax=Streptomyces sp. SBT349 TaxID=1580539 RepID=UPI00066A3256